jgi:hypothetical protein
MTLHIRLYLAPRRGMGKEVTNCYLEEKEEETT